MKVLLIGSGAVGIAMAVSLIESGADVHIVARGSTYEALGSAGIVRRGVFPTVSFGTGAFGLHKRIADAGSGYDYILICAKTTANEPIAAELKECGPGILTENGCVVLCQNGFGNERAYTGFFEPARIYTASFAIGFIRPQPHISEITVFSSPVAIGSMFSGDHGLAERLADAMSGGGLPAKKSEDIQKTVWAKMLYNCTLNPLSALLGTDYGGLADSNDAVSIMNQIIEEIFSVLKAAGYSTFWPDAEAYKQAFYSKILPPTYRHRSSTLQDMERRIKTEIDSLNGMVVCIGEENEVDTPCNRMIVRLVKARETLY